MEKKEVSKLKNTKIKKKQELPKRVPLVTVFLENDEINHAYNEEQSDVIVSNNRLIYGTLGKIQAELIGIETESVEENNDEEQDSDDVGDSSEDEGNESTEGEDEEEEEDEVEDDEEF